MKEATGALGVFAIAVAAAGILFMPAAAAEVKAVPVFHVTDLFRPHDDPDDHWDLVTQYALAKRGFIDLRGVMIDCPSRQFVSPDVIAVSELNWITALSVPVGVGQPAPNAEIRSGLALLRQTLEKSGEPVFLHVVGACKDVAEAAQRWPDLFRKKVKGVYLNAGAGVDDGKLEWNVALDPESYARMFSLPCPVYWMPCFHHVTDPMEEGRYGTFWRFRQGGVFSSLRPEMQNFFISVLSRERETDWLRVLKRPVDDGKLAEFGAQERNMWCTAGFLHAAGLTVRDDGRVVKLGENPSREVFAFRPVRVHCTKDGRTSWSPAEGRTDRYIFEVRDAAHYRAAMTKALAEMTAML